MKLVDAPHSKCGTLGYVGSSPTAPTIMNTYSRFNVCFKKGRGCWVWDDKGKKYLDGVSGIATCSLGHSDRILRRRLTNQLKKIQHVSNLYKIEEQEKLSEWLIKNSCAESVFFCNSGAEAIEAAIKLIKKYGNIKNDQKESIILSAKSSFHGRTFAALSATGQPKYHKGFEPLLNCFKFFEYNNVENLEKIFRDNNSNRQKISGIIIEPIQGEGGVIQGDKKFFKRCRELCNDYNSLLILDEIQSGVGRTGKLWGYENLGIEPDAFTLAKGLGGGHAIGALLVNKKANIFQPGDHASTFGGNPFACRAGLTVLEEIERRNILDNTLLRGEQLDIGLKELVDDFPNLISSKRGVGLLQGLLLKSESINAKTISLKALEKGLLLVPAGENVIRIVPPLIISKKETKILLKKLRLIFEEI